MAKTPRARAPRKPTPTRKPRAGGSGGPPPPAGTPPPATPPAAPAAPVASGQMPDWLQKTLWLGTVGGVAYNKGVAEGTESAGGGWSAPATTPENTAIKPEDVKANAKEADKKPEGAPNSSTPAGSPNTGSSTKTPVAEANTVGANAITPEEVKQNVEMDPNSSGKPWGERQGNVYKDATGRMVTDNPIARSQQAYLNQYGMPTARQRDADINAQLSDRNSPMYQAYDRMTGGSLTKQREWEADKEMRDAPRKLLEGITPEQKKILAKFEATGEGPDPKYRMPEPDYSTPPAQQTAAGPAAVTNPDGSTTITGVDASQFRVGGAPNLASQVQAQATSQAPVQPTASKDPSVTTDSEGNPIATMDENDPWVQEQLAEAERQASMYVDPAEDRYKQRGELNDRTYTQAGFDNLSGLGQFADEGFRVGSSVAGYGLGNTLLGKGNLSGLRGAVYSINPSKAAYVPQFLANATPQPVANAINSALGRNLTTVATATGAKAIKNPTVGQVMKANKANTLFAGLNAAGGLAAAYNEFTGDNYDPYALVGMGNTEFGAQSGQKGKRANAHQWAGKEGSRYIGAAEALFNNLSAGGYDAMRANMWGGDDYIAQRGGVVDVDPLGAGNAAENLSDKIFGLWNDWRNPKSPQLKAHEAQRKREWIARQALAQARNSGV